MIDARIVTSKIASFQWNKKPTTSCNAGFVRIRGMPPSKVPAGQIHLLGVEKARESIIHIGRQQEKPNSIRDLAPRLSEYQDSLLGSVSTLSKEAPR